MWKWLVFSLIVSASLYGEPKVLAFAGSTRKDSLNKKLVAEAASMANQMGAKVLLIDLKDYAMPFYDADLEAKEGLPPNAKRLRELIDKSDVIFIASPQYNASISAVLKNALDWVSRNERGAPYRPALRGKKIVIMSASPGRSGGARGLSSLREILRDIGGNVLSQQVSIPRANQVFNSKGFLINPKYRNELQQVVAQALHDYLEN